jgi:hypothetical protein
MLSPNMKHWGYIGWLQQTAAALKEQSKPEPPKTVWAKGSMEWYEEREGKREAELAVAAAEKS